MTEAPTFFPQRRPDATCTYIRGHAQTKKVFQRLTAEWKATRGPATTVKMIVQHPSCQAIIELEGAEQGRGRGTGSQLDFTVPPGGCRPVRPGRRPASPRCRAGACGRGRVGDGRLPCRRS